MPRVQHGVGRPKKPPNLRPAKSKSKCWTCNRLLRKDKLVEHIKKNVVWVDSGAGRGLIPANVEDCHYISASEINQKHTDYMREKDYNYNDFAKYIGIASAVDKSGPMDAFLKRNRVNTADTESEENRTVILMLIRNRKKYSLWD